MNEKSYSESYKAAGVDITAGYRAVELMKSHIARTKNEGCLDDIGGFGGLFGLNLKGYEEPVLVSGTDGVGTKLRLAFLLDKHDTVGIDCVAMCVNDVICCGAKPGISAVSPPMRAEPAWTQPSATPDTSSAIRSGTFLPQAM